MRFFLNEKIIQSRLSKVDDYTDIYATVTALVWTTKPQMLAAQDSQMYDGQVGQTYQIFTDLDLDINENDRLRDTFSAEYKVHTVSRVDYGVYPYKKIIIIKEKC
jgi:hypothetical protein